MDFGGLVTHEKGLWQLGDSTHRASREAAVTLWELGAASTGHQTPCSLSRRYLFPFFSFFFSLFPSAGKVWERLGMLQPQHCCSKLL